MNPYNDPIWKNSKNQNLRLKQKLLFDKLREEKKKFREWLIMIIVYKQIEMSKIERL